MDRIWTYWEGRCPPLIEACLESMRRQCGGRLTILTPDNWRDHVPPGTLVPEFSRVDLPAHRADCLRAAVLALHGGVYLDADTVCLRPPDPPCGPGDAVCSLWTNGPPRVLNGYLRIPAGHPLGPAWLDGVNRRLADGRPRGWTDLGEGVLTPLVLRPGTRSVGLQHTWLAPLPTWLPIDVDADPRPLARPGDWRSRVLPYTLVFGLNHSWLARNRRSTVVTPRQRWRENGPLVHRLLLDVLRGRGI